MEKRKGFFAYRGRPFTRIREEEAGLAIIISDTGEGETSVEMIGQARRLGYHTLVFTGNDRSRAAAEADLPVIIGEGGGEFRNSEVFIPFVMLAFVLLFEEVGSKPV